MGDIFIGYNKIRDVRLGTASIFANGSAGVTLGTTGITGSGKYFTVVSNKVINLYLFSASVSISNGYMSDGNNRILLKSHYPKHTSKSLGNYYITEILWDYKGLEVIDPDGSTKKLLSGSFRITQWDGEGFKLFGTSDIYEKDVFSCDFLMLGLPGTLAFSTDTSCTHVAFSNTQLSTGQQLSTSRIHKCTEFPPYYGKYKSTYICLPSNIILANTGNYWSSGNLYVYKCNGAGLILNSLGTVTESNLRARVWQRQ